MAYLNIASVITFVSIFYFNRHTTNSASTLITIACIEIIVHAVSAVLITGWQSNFHLYLLAAMIITFLTGELKNISSYILIGVSLLTYVFLSIYTNHNSAFMIVSETGMLTFEIMNIVGISFVIVILTVYYNYVAHQSSQKLLEANDELKEQSDKVILFNNELAQQAEELQIQSEQLEYANKYTTDSIKYALRIQEAILPSSSDLQAIFGKDNIMVFYSPKDIVSGDFYWARQVGDKKIIVVADCTGHGVPGAMLTMIGENLLNNIILEKEITEPAFILDALQVYFSTLFAGNIHNIQDGMDVCISKIDYKTNKLHFAGARNSLFYIQKGMAKPIKGDKMSIGQSKTGREKNDKELNFTPFQIDISVPTTIYMHTDGFQDQFGGKENRKFYSKNLRKLLLEIHDEPMPKQRTYLKRVFMDWCDFTKQTDDVTLVGIKIDTKYKNTEEVESQSAIKTIIRKSKKLMKQNR